MELAKQLISLTLVFLSGLNPAIYESKNFREGSYYVGSNIEFTDVDYKADYDVYKSVIIASTEKCNLNFGSSDGMPKVKPKGNALAKEYVTVGRSVPFVWDASRKNATLVEESTDYTTRFASAVEKAWDTYSAEYENEAPIKGQVIINDPKFHSDPNRYNLPFYFSTSTNGRIEVVAPDEMKVITLNNKPAMLFNFKQQVEVRASRNGILFDLAESNRLSNKQNIYNTGTIRYTNGVALVGAYIDESNLQFLVGSLERWFCCCGKKEPTTYKGNNPDLPLFSHTYSTKDKKEITKNANDLIGLAGKTGVPQKKEISREEDSEVDSNEILYSVIIQIQKLKD